MTPASRRYPTVVEVFASPELSVLALLEAAVDVALVALVAAHPDDEPDPGAVPVERRAAKSLIAAAGALAVALDRYRLALARARDRNLDDQLPF
jgi:hypothetical protein